MSCELPPSLDHILSKSAVALFLDFDGTLVEIAPSPDAIDVPSELADNLGALAQRLDGACALVSGRALDDISAHLGGSLPVFAAGSHGADIRDPDGQSVGQVPSGIPPAIERAMKDFAREHSLEFERKPHGAALHYRADPSKMDDAHAFAETLAHSHGWTTQSGKCVVELVEGRSDKGSAVRTLMQDKPFIGARPVFIGDDLTDEKGFEACAEFNGLGILVGSREPTKARYQLPDVASVHRWLGL